MGAALVIGLMLQSVSSLTCPQECICLSQSQVLCNTGGLTEIPLKHLPPTVEHLSLTKNTFPIIKSDAFAGLRSLKKLSLDGNNITTIKPFAFRGLPKLRELSIQHTPLATVAQFAFAGLQNITAILLGHNKIQKVEGFAFAGTSNVRLILLSSNPIQKIESSAFSGLTNIEHLILPSGIKVLEPDAFTNLDAVGLIKLPFMDLGSLQKHTFRGLTHVHVLSIQESDLGVIQSGAFEGMTHIGSLNLLNNKIDAIQELHIHNSNKVKIMRLHGNHLLETPAAGAVVIQGVESLSVVSNHFPCDCHVHSLLEGPLANASHTEFANKNFCISPMEVNGKAIAELDLESIGRCQEEVTRGNLEASLSSSSCIVCHVTLLVYTFIFTFQSGSR
ncbi:chondroadherin [Nilaparvata lugens]|uniref:chondroadherin n=1 Tax=Nilaparvata lugens TaxID=108931 RepID=UPI000B998E6A|nr:chondroadherin [Nilaparvata lugens]XP_039295030.1 chondroadherin [Nilaparvata lugens]XP_039295031.1 chondroadherin [Nilaparvata lugens]XP_039295032.1 chondroadherin [Nilaparvata lugens]XP_039295033.1 chondroadherin [Nilaparvata lugens]XP_039295034.1 chondroadherin [Nilaparvata lugens]